MVTNRQTTSGWIYLITEIRNSLIIICPNTKIMIRQIIKTPPIKNKFRIPLMNLTTDQLRILKTPSEKLEMVTSNYALAVPETV